MRKILFRGFHECKSGTEIAVVNGTEHMGKWVEGCYVFDNNLNYNIRAFDNCYYAVIPETVGLWTGLTDKNGMKMFERDKLKDNKGQVGTIFYSETAAAFLVNWKMKDGSFETDACFCGEVIGTIFDKDKCKLFKNAARVKKVEYKIQEIKCDGAKGYDKE